MKYRHKKRGTIYEVVGRAELQLSNVDRALEEGDVIVFYKDDHGNLWAREESEFDDGRFESL